MDTSAGRLGVSGGFRCGPPHSHPYPPTPSFNDGRLAAPDRLRARRAVASGVEWRREGSSAVASVHCLPSQQPFRAPLLLLWRRPPAVLSGSAGGPLALPPPYPLIRDSTPLALTDGRVATTSRCWVRRWAEAVPRDKKKTWLLRTPVGRR